MEKGLKGEKVEQETRLPSRLKGTVGMEGRDRLRKNEGGEGSRTPA